MDIKQLIDDLIAKGVELDEIVVKLQEEGLTEEQIAEALAYIEQIKEKAEKAKAFELFGIE